MDRTFAVTSEEETEAAGADIARLLPAHGVVYLRGDLGAGKTTLIRAIAAARGVAPDDVASPTFAIVHEYDAPDGRLIHLDCYRLSDSQREWEEIGIPEILRGGDLVLIEWPKEEFARYTKPVAMIDIEIGAGDARLIRLHG